MGRPQVNRKTAHPNSKLTEAQAYAIKFIEPGTAPHVAEKYGVSIQTVYNIRWGATWGWLKPKQQQVSLDLGARQKSSTISSDYSMTLSRENAEY